MNQVGVLVDSSLRTHTWSFSACAEAPRLPCGRGCRWVCVGQPLRRACVGMASREAGPAAGDKGSPLDFSGGSTTLTGPWRDQKCGLSQGPQDAAWLPRPHREAGGSRGGFSFCEAGPCGRRQCYREKWGVCGLSTEPRGEGEALPRAARPWPWFSVQKVQGFFPAKGVS